MKPFLKSHLNYIIEVFYIMDAILKLLIRKEQEVKIIKIQQTRSESWGKKKDIMNA